ncbi:uncharacterized protein PRCAT00003498001 [Priceomyces carsonii]|uniref:uncharacterized protein n=1 Tax=Priceomyces carsonii TaxID=28549 RepID=UPI002ED8F92E|nr:unnamed protein product [Priceomyces carsonii]
MSNRKKKVYSCGPCKKLKAKCNRSLPCERCIRNNREESCYLQPPRLYDKFKQLSLPDINFHCARNNDTQNLKQTNHGLKESKYFPKGDDLGTLISELKPQHKQEQLVSSENIGTERSRFVSSTGKPKNNTCGSPIEKSKLFWDFHLPICVERLLGIYHESELKFLRKKNVFSMADLLDRSTDNTNIDFNILKSDIVQLLPTKEAAIALKNYYLQFVDYIYHPIHHPTFNKDFEKFYMDLENQSHEKIDLLWVSLLLMVLTLALIHLPKSYSTTAPFRVFSEEIVIKKTADAWSKASIWLYDISKDVLTPRLEELQLFSLLQLYYYATKQSEELNTFLVLSINTAYTLGLNKPYLKAKSPLEQEMRRRLWWDICGCDTFCALCNGRTPMIRSYISKVPLPSNVNDRDMGDSFIIFSEDHIPTDNSFNIHRAKMMKILNGMFEINQLKDVTIEDYENNKEVLEGIISIDIELCDYVSNLPWYFKLDKDGNLPEHTTDKLKLQIHILHTCVCIHRLRLFQNYLTYNIPIAWEVCISTAKAMFIIYKKLRVFFKFGDNTLELNNALREPIGNTNNFNKLFLTQLHQTFTASVTQAMVLLMLTKKKNLAIRRISKEKIEVALFHDISLFLGDLHYLNDHGSILKSPILEQSVKGLNLLKTLYLDLNPDLMTSSIDRSDYGAISDISTVFGGKESTEKYLKKCSVDYIVNQPDEIQDVAMIPNCYNSTYNFNFSNQFGIIITKEDKLIDDSLEYFLNVIDMERICQNQNQSDRVIQELLNHSQEQMKYDNNSANNEQNELSGLSGELKERNMGSNQKETYPPLRTLSSPVDDSKTIYDDYNLTWENIEDIFSREWNTTYLDCYKLS